MSVAGPFDAIWDCNAIVAVNIEDRTRYVELLVSLLKPNGRVLMTTWLYEQNLHLRRPFSISPEKIQDLFKTYCDTREVETIDMTGSNFCQQHDLPWAKRPVLLLARK